MTAEELKEAIYGLALDYARMGMKYKLMHHHLLIQCLETPDQSAQEVIDALLDEATDDPHYHGFTRSEVQGFLVRYKDELDIKEVIEDRPWVDCAGGIHDPDEPDPARKYT